MLRKRDICMTTIDVHSIVRVVIVNTTWFCMLTLKIWTHMYSVTIALTARESTKWNLIKNITGEDRAKFCGYILLYIRKLFESYSKFGPALSPKECIMRFITSRSPVKPQVVAESYHRHRLCTVRCKSFNQIRGTLGVFSARPHRRVRGHNRGGAVPL